MFETEFFLNLLEYNLLTEYFTIKIINFKIFFKFLLSKNHKKQRFIKKLIFLLINDCVKRIYLKQGRGNPVLLQKPFNIKYSRICFFSIYKWIKKFFFFKQKPKKENPWKKFFILKFPIKQEFKNKLNLKKWIIFIFKSKIKLKEETVPNKTVSQKRKYLIQIWNKKKTKNLLYLKRYLLEINPPPSKRFWYKKKVLFCKPEPRLPKISKISKKKLSNKVK